MEIADISFLRLDLEGLRSILFELTIRDEDIRRYGLSRVLQQVPVAENLFDDVSTKLVRLLRSSESMDFQMSEELKHLVAETKVQDSLAELDIMLRVAKHKRPRHSLLYPMSRMFFGTKPAENTECIAKALTGVSRLIPMLNAIEAIELNRTADDDEVLKPSGIDQRVVVSRIDAAIHAIESAPNIQQVYRVTVITYLEEAKAEAKKERPLWQKIIGALVITATILQGIAAAPDAVTNLKEAVTYIAGASVAPPPPQLQFQQFEPQHSQESQEPQSGEHPTIHQRLIDI